MKPRIMIVEDERIIALGLKLQLEGLGFIVTDIASSFVEVMEKIEKTIPDIILMDIYIKGNKDGIETAMALNEKFNIPIIFLTSYSDEASFNRALLAKPYAYLIKPVNEIHLVDNILLSIDIHNQRNK